MPDCRLHSKLGDDHTTCVRRGVATGGGVGRRVGRRKVTAGRSANGRLRSRRWRPAATGHAQAAEGNETTVGLRDETSETTVVAENNYRVASETERESKQKYRINKTRFYF